MSDKTSSDPPTLMSPPSKVLSMSMFSHLPCQHQRNLGISLALNFQTPHTSPEAILTMLLRASLKFNFQDEWHAWEYISVFNKIFHRALWILRPKSFGSKELEKKFLSIFFVYNVFLKPHFTVLKEKKKKMIKIYALSYQLMLDFWLHKSPGYFSTIPAYENIKLFNHYTFLLVSISLNQRKFGKQYLFHLLIIR